MAEQLVAERGGTVVYSHACAKGGPAFSHAVSWSQGYPVPVDTSGVPFTEACPVCGEPVTVTGELPRGEAAPEPEPTPDA